MSSASNPLTVAANRAFEAAVAELVAHDRLREALTDMLRGEVQSSTARRGALEGTAAPEARLTAYAAAAGELAAEEGKGALFLHLGNKELGVAGTRELARLFTPPTRSPAVTAGLVFLDLSDNYATDLGKDFDALRNLLYQLAKCTSLRFLALHNTSLLDKGAAMLARLLRTSTSLRQLDASRCALGDRGAAALFAAFCGDEDYDAAALADASDDDAAGTPAAASATAGGDSKDAASPAAATGGGAAKSPAAAAAAAAATAAPAAAAPAAAATGATAAPAPAAPAAAAAASADNLGFNFGAGTPGRPASATGSSRVKTTVRSKVAAAAAAPTSAAAATAAATGTTAAAAAAAAASPAVAASGVNEGRNVTLQWLDLSSNNLGGYGLDPVPGAKLVRALMEHPALTYLDLSRNRFTRSIVNSLVAGLEVNKSLTTLILDCNGVDAVPAVRMAEVLAAHPRMTHLSLRLNAVRSDGAAAFAHLLASQPHGTLTYIDLRDNYIGPVGTIAVLEAMGVAVPAAARALVEPPRDVVAGRTPREGDVLHDTPLGGGPVLAGSGAAALLALRRGAKAAAPAAVPEVTESSVTADGTVAQWVVKPAAAGVGVEERKGDDDDAAALPGWTRVVRLDGDTVAAVLRAGH